MQVDPVGASLGAASLSGQLVTLCISAIDVWQTAEDIGESVLIFKTRLKCMSARLKAWKLEWGLDRNVHIYNPRFQQFGDVAADYIALIHLIGSRLEIMDSRYPIIGVASNVPNPGQSFMQRLASLAGIDTVQRHKLEQDIRGVRDSSNVTERLRWALQNKKKAGEALDLVQALIDDLYKLLPPPASDPAAQLVTNPALLSQNIKEIKTISTLPDVDPAIAGMSLLRIATIELQSRSSTVGDLDIQKKRRELKELSQVDSRNARGIGKFQGKQHVLIEWKTIDKEAKEPEKLEQRVKELARLLQSTQKPEELRTLSCLGAVEEVDPQTSSVSYGLLYAIPLPTFFSLREILFQPEGQLLLGNRFEIAKTISKTILYLHLAGWLHKGIRSDNVIFFAHSICDVNPSAPYLVGFEYSRTDVTSAITEETLLDPETDFNLYRHPDCQGFPYEPKQQNPRSGVQLVRIRPRFSRIHDIYALGVLLLELGLRSTIGKAYQKHLKRSGISSLGSEEIASWMKEKLVPRLGDSMGSIYRDATSLCLTGTFDVSGDRTLEVAFYVDVIRQLEQCNA